MSLPALAHAAPDEATDLDKVVVTATRTPTTVDATLAAVEVIDSGPGLSAEDAAKLFTRGYRGTHAGHSQGGGIGLSIVRRLCTLYGWDVQVRPGEVNGVVATLRFA